MAVYSSRAPQPETGHDRLPPRRRAGHPARCGQSLRTVQAPPDQAEHAFPLPRRHQRTARCPACRFRPARSAIARAVAACAEGQAGWLVLLAASADLLCRVAGVLAQMHDGGSCRGWGAVLWQSRRAAAWACGGVRARGERSARVPFGIAPVRAVARAGADAGTQWRCRARGRRAPGQFARCPAMADCGVPELGHRS